MRRGYIPSRRGEALIQEIRDATLDGGEGLLAIIITKQPFRPGVLFVTPPEALLQVALMCREADSIVHPHIHNPVERRTIGTQETLIVKRGYVELAIHATRGCHVQTVCLGPGDVAVLLGGAHSLKMLCEAHIIEVKSGPYVGSQDKRYL